jgi:hypothetical protein
MGQFYILEKATNPINSKLRIKFTIQCNWVCGIYTFVTGGSNTPIQKPSSRFQCG